MNTEMWVAATLLAVVFISTGLVKIVRPESNRFGGTDPVVRAIGVAETAGGVGVVVPAVTGILPILGPIAAIGLALIMIGAIATGIRLRRGVGGMVVPLLLAVLAVTVAWGEFSAYVF